MIRNSFLASPLLAACAIPALASVTVNTPSNGATVSTPFTLSALATTCSDQTVSAMGYSLDSSSDTTIIDATSIDAAVTAAAGAHTLHVKAWGDKGASCVTDVAITVTDPVTDSSSSSTVPSDAVSVSNIQTLGTWEEANDPGTDGPSSGSMKLVTSPAVSGDSREFVTSFSGSGGEIYHVAFGDDTSSENFFYDGWVYLTSSASSIANLEMDMNQVAADGQTVIYGFQCDGYSGTWDYTENAGTPSKPTDHWVHSSASCDVRNWSRSAWHHVQISYSRNDSGDVTYHSVWLDGAESGINATVPSSFALGWAPVLLTNFQVDGLGSGSNTVYLDELKISRW